jgi:alkylation response protein AidB-like acyl-CoA dehydrogenase
LLWLGLFIVLANADFSKGYKGITGFLVERGTPGLEVGKKEDKVSPQHKFAAPLHVHRCVPHVLLLS